MIGRGRDRGAATSWGGYSGWLYAATGTLRWGTNRVSARNLDVLGTREGLAFAPFSRFPEVVRDLSILAPTAANAAEIVALARAAAGPAARRVELVDRFEGTGVPAGQVSLTLSFLFQDEARTLSSEEVERSMDAVRSSFSEKGFGVRGVA